MIRNQVDTALSSIPPLSSKVDSQKGNIRVGGGLNLVLLLILPFQ
jgi:hypothetical protein